MTREEILNMPAGIEMDAAIANYVLMLTVDPIRCPYCGEEMWMGKTRSRCSNCNEWRYSPYKQYSDEIESAWEVVEKMHGGFELRLHEHKFTKTLWQAEFHEPGSASYMINAETAPLAICRAALLAMLE